MPLPSHYDENRRILYIGNKLHTHAIQELRHMHLRQKTGPIATIGDGLCRRASTVANDVGSGLYPSGRHFGKGNSSLSTMVMCTDSETHRIQAEQYSPQLPYPTKHRWS